MKIVAKYLGHLYDSKHNAELRLRIDNYRHTQYLDELDREKEYQVEIKEVKSKRSLEQNRFLWKLLSELEKASKIDIMIWYANILEETNCKYTHLMGLEGIDEQLLNAFRAVRKLGKREVNGKEVMVYRCYYGSSHYTVKEMTELIEVVLRWCAEYNIDTELYKYE